MKNKGLLGIEDIMKSQKIKICYKHQKEALQKNTIYFLDTLFYQSLT